MCSRGIHINVHTHTHTHTHTQRERERLKDTLADTGERCFPSEGDCSPTRVRNHILPLNTAAGLYAMVGAAATLGGVTRMTGVCVRVCVCHP